MPHPGMHGQVPGMPGMPGPMPCIPGLVAPQGEEAWKQHRLDGQEAWMATPAPASLSDLDGYGIPKSHGSHLPLSNLETWSSSPAAHYVDPLHYGGEPIDYFPDMINLNERRKDAATEAHERRMAETMRKKVGLPEMGDNAWKDVGQQRGGQQRGGRPQLALTETANGNVAAPEQRKAPERPASSKRAKLLFEHAFNHSRNSSNAFVNQINQQFQNPRITELDSSLEPAHFQLQVVGCLRESEAPIEAPIDATNGDGSAPDFPPEKPVFIRRGGPASDERWVGSDYLGVTQDANTRRHRSRASSSSNVTVEDRLSNGLLTKWLKEFGMEDELRIGISCRKGKRRKPLPNQDNFSLSLAPGDLAVYVVCDGHGPFGHIVAFRVVQSLPKHILDDLRGENPSSPERAIMQAFEAASQDLQQFAQDQQLDLSTSGATVSLALREGYRVQVAWLGDARAMVASVTGTKCKVDLLTPTHTTENPKERERIVRKGASLRREPKYGAERLFRPGENVRTPGLFATRTLGDFDAWAYGVIWQPDIQKTSFDGAPGFVLLATDGLWEVLDGPPATLLEQIAGDNTLENHGPQWASRQLLSNATDKWLDVEGGFCDDVTCLILDWTRTEVAPPIAPLGRRPGPPEVAGSQSNADVPVRVRFDNLELPRIGAEPRRQLIQQIVVALASIVGVPPDEVRDGQGRPSSVSLRPGSVIAECGIRGVEPAAVCRALAPDPALKQLAAAAESVPGVAPNGAGTVFAEVVGFEEPRAAPPRRATGSVRFAEDETPVIVKPSGPRRLKPIVNEDQIIEEVAQRINDTLARPEFEKPYDELIPRRFDVQVVGSLQQIGDAALPMGSEKPVWLRTAQDPQNPKKMNECDDTFHTLLKHFQGEHIQVAVSCRYGHKPGPSRQDGSLSNQDTYSITKAIEDRAVYVVCDGHGPWGQLASFHVAQSLPKFILDGLEGARGRLEIEAIIAGAFKQAAAELQRFGDARGIDFSCSGTTCSLLFRERDAVWVAWLGDSRVLLATIGADLGDFRKCERMTNVHALDQQEECTRFVQRGARVEKEPLRAYSPDSVMRPGLGNPSPGLPGLSISRAFGDFALASRGLVQDPDLVKTNFAKEPGAVLLASGGACEHLNDGDAILDLLALEGRLCEDGPKHALSVFCERAQEQWLHSDDAVEEHYVDDVTGLLVFWGTYRDGSQEDELLPAAQTGLRPPQQSFQSSAQQSFQSSAPTGAYSYPSNYHPQSIAKPPIRPEDQQPQQPSNSYPSNSHLQSTQPSIRTAEPQSIPVPLSSAQPLQKALDPSKITTLRPDQQSTPCRPPGSMSGYGQPAPLQAAQTNSAAYGPTVTPAADVGPRVAPRSLDAGIGAAPQSLSRLAASGTSVPSAAPSRQVPVPVAVTSQAPSRRSNSPARRLGSGQTLASIPETHT